MAVAGPAARMAMVGAVRMAEGLVAAVTAVGSAAGLAVVTVARLEVAPMAARAEAMAVVPVELLAGLAGG